jgi:hypothetical protein
MAASVFYAKRLLELDNTIRNFIEARMAKMPELKKKSATVEVLRREQLQTWITDALHNSPVFTTYIEANKPDSEPEISTGKKYKIDSAMGMILVEKYEKGELK